jgi:hypothetical protein
VAAIIVPVLVAIGERDVIADPKGKARAYQSFKSIDLYICPRIGHLLEPENSSGVVSRLGWNRFGRIRKWQGCELTRTEIRERRWNKHDEPPRERH